MLRERKRVSKFISYVLRHNPYKFNLKMDKQGYVELRDLIGVLRMKFPFVDEDYLRELVKEDKKRFEIKGDKIRALYGHSIDVEIEYPKIVPPDILYHGTSRQAVKQILKEGLKPMRRKFVHLSKNKEEAYRVGRRKDKSPLILEVRAKDAYNAGIVFYDAKGVILTPYIPPQYLRALE